MAGNFQSVRNLFKDFMINLFSGLAGGAIVGVLSERVWLGILSFGVLLIASVAYLGFSKYKRLFKLIRAGATGYYFSFDLGENRKVFSEVRDTFCYLGISANSILEVFRKWINEKPPIKSYSFLLMDPESPNLKRQIAFEKGVSLHTKWTDLSSSNIQLAQMIEKEAEAEKKRIYSAIDVLKNTTLFKEGKLKIRLHGEFIPWWMYLIDNKMIYLGILEKGKRGQESPVMILSKLTDFSSPFDPFNNTWDRMWSNAMKVKN